MQTLANALLVENVAAIARRTPREDDGLIAALAAILADTTLEPAFMALALTLPGEADIAREIGKRRRSRCDLCVARGACAERSASGSGRGLRETYMRCRTRRLSARTLTSAGRRALKNVSLDLLAADGQVGDRAARRPVPDRRQHDRPHGGARDAALYDRAGAQSGARRFLSPLCRRSADHRQMARVAGHDSRGRHARPRARR